MSDANEEALEQAYELIEAGKLAEAEALLKPVLEYAPDSADAWWLYAHSVQDPVTARMALNKVLSLDSAYEGAQDLLDRLDDTHAAQRAPSNSLLDDDSDVFDDFDEFSDIDDQDALIGPEDDFIFDEDVLPRDTGDRVQSGGRRRLMLLIPILLLILVIVLAVVLFNPFGSSTAPATPATAGVLETSPTAEEAATADGSETVMLDPVTDEISTAVTAALSDFSLADGSIGARDTGLGNTLVAGICSNADLRTTLDGAMNAIATVAETLGSDIEALGVALVDCENASTVLRAVAVPTDAAVAFGSGALDQRDYQAQWRPVD
jgi:hypothetical protein